MKEKPSSGLSRCGCRTWGPAWRVGGLVQRSPSLGRTSSHKGRALRSLNGPIRPHSRPLGTHDSIARAGLSCRVGAGDTSWAPDSLACSPCQTRGRTFWKGQQQGHFCRQL